MSVNGGFVESRFNTTIAASVRSERLHEALRPAFAGSAEAVAGWLLTNPGLDSRQILEHPDGLALVNTYFASIIHRRNLAEALVGDNLAGSFDALVAGASLSGLFGTLNTAQVGALSAGLSASQTPELSAFGADLAQAQQESASRAQAALADLTAQSDLLRSVIQELLRHESGELADIGRILVSGPDFIPVLLAQPDLVAKILAQPVGLSVLEEAIATTDLGGRVRWTPEEELNLALIYGYDALSWMTLDLGYRYFGAEKGTRSARVAGPNRDLSLAFARLRVHRLEAGFEFGCYIDVWRPFISLGASYAYSRFRAQDPLLGKLHRDEWLFSYYYGVGLDVDLSQYLEMSIGYRVEQYPLRSSQNTQQILYTPPGFEAPIRLDNVPVNIGQSGRVSGFFLFFRFFL